MPSTHVCRIRPAAGKRSPSARCLARSNGLDSPGDLAVPTALLLVAQNVLCRRVHCTPAKVGRARSDPLDLRTPGGRGHGTGRGERLQVSRADERLVRLDDPVAVFVIRFGHARYPAGAPRDRSNFANGRHVHLHRDLFGRRSQRPAFPVLASHVFHVQKLRGGDHFRGRSRLGKRRRLEVAEQRIMLRGRRRRRGRRRGDQALQPLVEGSRAPRSP